MLDFSFVADEKLLHTRGLAHAGGIEYEEFAKAQELKIADSHLDYYGRFRWISQQVKQKCALLTPRNAANIPNLANILRQAAATDCGLAAFSD
jgi:hypothetical protein